LAKKAGIRLKSELPKKYAIEGGELEELVDVICKKTGQAKPRLYRINARKKYLNVVLWINGEPDKYGNNASIQVGLSKEEREDRVKPTYIGNLKYNKGKSEGSKSGDDFPF
jgi:hypothetical protein